MTRHTQSAALAFLETLAIARLTPSRSMVCAEAVEAARNAVDAMPEAYQRAIRIVPLQGRPVREAAEEMGRSERAIHGLCRRGLSLLRKRIGNLGSLPHL